MDNFTRGTEHALPSLIPEKVECWCGSMLVRRTRSNLLGDGESICWPHHICPKCGSIARFTKAGFDAYMMVLQASKGVAPIVVSKTEVVEIPKVESTMAPIKETVADEVPVSEKEEASSTPKVNIKQSAIESAKQAAIASAEKAAKSKANK